MPISKFIESNQRIIRQLIEVLDRIPQDKRYFKLLWSVAELWCLNHREIQKVMKKKGVKNA